MLYPEPVRPTETLLVDYTPETADEVAPADGNVKHMVAIVPEQYLRVMKSEGWRAAVLSTAIYLVFYYFIPIFRHVYDASYITALLTAALDWLFSGSTKRIYKLTERGMTIASKTGPGANRKNSNVIRYCAWWSTKHGPNYVRSTWRGLPAITFGSGLFKSTWPFEESEIDDVCRFLDSLKPAEMPYWRRR